MNSICSNYIDSVLKDSNLAYNLSLHIAIEIILEQRRKTMLASYQKLLQKAYLHGLMYREDLLTIETVGHHALTSFSVREFL